MLRAFFVIMVGVLAAAAGSGRAQMPDLGPPPVFAAVDPALAALGQLLFYDPILSGNRDIACATCHHPRFGTSDGLSLGLGTGAVGLGPNRRAVADGTPATRQARNAPGLWNLGAEDVTVLFHDGRVQLGRDGRPRLPLDAPLPPSIGTLLAAQALFPLLSPSEMAGQAGENAVADAAAQGEFDDALARLAARVRGLPAYADAFRATGTNIVTPGAIVTALAAFVATEFRADQSLFDRAMRGEATLPPDAQRGMTLFYGRAGCSDCHAGWWQTDQAFHATGMPQIGPGMTPRLGQAPHDEGRMRVTGRRSDAFAFRTPSLRNVTRTGPYGHAGGYRSLRAVLRHYTDPVGALTRYDPAQAVLPDLPGARDDAVMTTPVWRAEIAKNVTLAPVALDGDEIDALLAFLATLEDVTPRLGVPDAVPSGLPVPR